MYSVLLDASPKACSVDDRILRANSAGNKLNTVNRRKWKLTITMVGTIAISEERVQRSWKGALKLGFDHPRGGT